MTLCDSGTLHVSMFAPPDRIVGRYSFMLQDGAKKEGEFAASYCPKSDAVNGPSSFKFEPQHSLVSIETLLWCSISEPFSGAGVELSSDSITLSLGETR